MSSLIKSIQNQEQNPSQKKLDDKLRIFANLLIDRFIEDTKKNKLKTKKTIVNIKLD